MDWTAVCQCGKQCVFTVKNALFPTTFSEIVRETGLPGTEKRKMARSNRPGKSLQSAVFERHEESAAPLVIPEVVAGEFKD